jgi:DNA-binding transcriptional LysR family regulator
MSAGFGLHHMLYRAAAVDGVELVPTLTSNSIGTLKHYAATGLGITFLSTHAVSEEVAAGKLVALRTSNDVLESVEAQLIVRAGRHVPMAASRLLSLLQATSAFGIRTSK